MDKSELKNELEKSRVAISRLRFAENTALETVAGSWAVKAIGYRSILLAVERLLRDMNEASRQDLEIADFINKEMKK